MSAIVSVQNVSKIYASGHQALTDVNLDIQEGEILALLGPNGAGKTTLISAICGITTLSSGTIEVAGHDVVRDYREARRLIGLVPQEVMLEQFENVINTLRFSRGVFGKPRNDKVLEDILRTLSLYDKRNAQLRELSGGMKRRVLIGKALSHEPRILFLDEPTAGVDVELRKDMWETVLDLKRQGVTIILTTHYIEEAEAIADRVAVINKGQILLVEDKATLMAQMGQKTLVVQLSEAIDAIPAALAPFNLSLSEAGTALHYSYDTKGEGTGITRLLSALQEQGLQMVDMETRQSSLEDIFVGLVAEPHQQSEAAQ